MMMILLNNLGQYIICYQKTKNWFNYNKFKGKIMKGIVTGGTRGIGKAIVEELRNIQVDVISTSSTDLDTSNIVRVKKFVDREKFCDILVMNTGGPPAKDFFEIKEEEWHHFYNQLFYSFVYILQKLYINDNGYIFLI